MRECLPAKNVQPKPEDIGKLQSNFPLMFYIVSSAIITHLFSREMDMMTYFLMNQRFGYQEVWRD